MNILIDTDVILDFFFDRKPFSDNSAKILSLCEDKKIRGFITPVIVSNIYYILRKKAVHEKVIDNLQQLITITEVLTIDRNVVVKALNSGFKDFEDALQNYSAESFGDIDLIVTRNFKDFKNSALSVVSPDEFLKAFLPVKCA